MTPEEAAQLLDVQPEAEMRQVTRSFFRCKDELLASAVWEQEREAYERAVRVLRAESLKRAAQAQRDQQARAEAEQRKRQLERLARRVEGPSPAMSRDEASALLSTAADSDVEEIHECYERTRSQLLAAGTWHEQAAQAQVAKAVLLSAAADRIADAKKERVREESGVHESSRLARSEATREGWPTAWFLDGFAQWRQSGWIVVAQAWANAGWHPTTDDLQRLRQLAGRTGKQVLGPPRGRASSWAPAGPVLARALSSRGVRVGIMEEIRKHGPHSVLGYERWVDAGEEDRAAAWLAKMIPAQLAFAAVDAGIDVHEVSSADELKVQLAARGRLSTQEAGLPAVSAPAMLRSKQVLGEAGEGVLLEARCPEGRLSTLRRESKSWVVTDCRGCAVRLSLDDWWQAIYSMLPEQRVASLQPVELDRGRFLLAVAPLAATMGEEMAVGGEVWWTIDGWPATDSGSGAWAELDRKTWKRPEYLDEAAVNSAEDWEFVLRRLGDDYLAYEYHDGDVSVQPLAVTSHEEALRAFEARATDPWVTERAEEEIWLAEPLVVRSWRGESGLTGGSATDELVETPSGRLVYRGVGDSPAGIYGPEDLGSAEDDKAGIVASWLDGLRALTAAALELEPLDPHRTLRGDQRQEWDRLMTHRFDSVDFHLDAEAIAAVRDRLHRTPAYARVAAALREPLSRDGLILLESLREAERRRASVEELT